jgi:hypothetical protein
MTPEYSAPVVIAIGKRLRLALSTDEAYSILNTQKGLEESSWTAGGCWILAKIISAKTKGQLIGVYAGQILHHVVVKLGDMYIDADGVSTEHGLLKRWREEEHLRAPYLGAFDEKKARAGGIVCPRPTRSMVELIDRILTG